MTALVIQVVAAVAATSGVFPMPAGMPRQHPECTIVGTPGNDYLRGTPGDDVICGLGGNDVLFGLTGDDVLIGGPGRDVLVGGPGHDELYGNDGNDVLIDTDGIGFEDGGRGNDNCVGVGGTQFVNCEHVVTLPGRDLAASSATNAKSSGGKRGMGDAQE